MRWGLPLQRPALTSYDGGMIGGVTSAPAAGFLVRSGREAQGRSRPEDPERSDAQTQDTKTAQTEETRSGAPDGADGKPLSRDEERMVRELQLRDREVRAHEAAHKAAGGSLAGGMSLSYQTGPDGRQYAVGGEVSIDTGSAGDPQATIGKMRQVIAAALAPADPSSQDRAVAAAARATMAEAQRQLGEQQRATTEAQRSGPTAGQDGNQAKAERLGPSLGGYRPAPGGGGSGGLLSLIA